MNEPIKISVILCTYNRFRTLGATIQSVVEQEVVQSSGWELVVVDNNSNDATRSVVENFQSLHPERVRYVFEPRQGISYARNTGIREARGKIIAFIDDDETADPNWLQNLTANLGNAEWAGAGGRVLPPPEFRRPRWLASKNPFIQGPMAEFDPDLEAGPLSEPPFGANMAFRKDVFEAHGGFRTDLGRAGASMLSNEDTEFGRRLFAAGRQLRYEPGAITYHPVEETRLRREYFLNWWFNKGRSDARELWNRYNRMSLLGVPLRMFYDVAVECARWIFAVNPANRFISKLKIWSYAGESFESYQLWRNTKRQPSLRNASIRPPVVK
jgi:glucosyl-dolichyl phosphate glucuronosyltransferase